MNEYDYEYDDIDEVFPEDDDLEGVEELEELLEGYEEDDDEEAEDDDDAAERRRRRRRRRRARRQRSPAVAKGQRNAPRRQPTKKYVTQEQWKAGQTLDARERRKNGVAIKKVNSRLNKTNSLLNSLDSTHRRDVKKIKNEVKQARDMSLLMTLMQTTTQATTAAIEPANFGGVGVPAGTKFVTGGNNMLPLLLMFSGTGTGGGGIMDNPLILFMFMESLK